MVNSLVNVIHHNVGHTHIQKMSEESMEHYVGTDVIEYDNGAIDAKIAPLQPEFEDMDIPCIDCGASFVWTVGEQTFFRDKGLQNPPKRCKECKKAKNIRLEAIEKAKITGERHKIEVKASCAKCKTVTTVPFYPCQGRPVYCRSCFQQMHSKAAISV